MKKLFILSLTILLGLGLVLISGCSDDDDDGLKTGDPDDPEIEFVSDIAGQVNFQLNLQLLDLTFGLIDELSGEPRKVPGKLGVASGAQINYLHIIDHDTSNFWHIVTCSVEVTDEDDVFFAYRGVDSLRFGDGTSYMYEPDETVTILNIRGHFNIGFEFTDEDETTSGEIGSHERVDLSGVFGADEFTLDGHAYDSLDFEISSDSATCDLAMYFSETINDLFIDDAVTENGDCPLDGDVSLNFTVNLACTGEDELNDLDVNGQWSASFEFDNGTVDMVYENETTRWTISEQCRNDVAKHGFKQAIQGLK
nr:hypothetical protein [candidate division Zixibacteria bacterium]